MFRLIYEIFIFSPYILKAAPPHIALRAWEILYKVRKLLGQQVLDFRWPLILSNSKILCEKHPDESSTTWAENMNLLSIL